MRLQHGEVRAVAGPSPFETSLRFQLAEADRLNRKGEAAEARSWFLEAQKAAEAASQELRF